MGPYLIIFAGAGLGGAARHAVNLAAARLGLAFPWGTFAVNVAGSFLMGVLAAWFASRTGAPQHMKLFLTTGVLGGFTTFSAFGVETVYLLRRHEYAVAIGYVAMSVVGGIAGLWVAMSAIRPAPAST